jgi:hypothetical protein
MSESPDQELTRLQAALQALVPRPANLDRDRVMYEAGRASVRSPRYWPLAALGASAVAACLVAVLVLRSPPSRVVEIVRVPILANPQLSEPHPEQFVEHEAPATAPQPQDLPSEHSLWRLQQAMQMGIDQMLAPSDSTPMGGAAPPGSAIPTIGSRSCPATLAITGDF